MLNFDNTEIAFSSKSNAELKKAYWLFKMVGSNALVKFGKSFTHFAFQIGLPIKSIVKATIFKQFCGGESIDDCAVAIKNLSKYNVGTILDYSVEGKESDENFEHTAQEIMATILKAKGKKEIPFSVFKVTGIAKFSVLEKVNANEKLTEEEQKLFDQTCLRIEKICRTAFENDVKIFIDAEESWIQDCIDNLAEQMMIKFNQSKVIVYNTLQMYRHDRLEFLKKSFDKAQKGNYFLGVKIVRGAYMEKERLRASEKNYPSPIQKDKQSTDNDYNAAIRFSVENLDRIAICAGTHNELSSLQLTELLQQKGIDKNHSHVFFAQLLGMSDHISFNLAKENFNVAKYVPYGPVKEVLPYLIRRAEENTSVAGQTSRELGLLTKEINRRKI